LIEKRKRKKKRAKFTLQLLSHFSASISHCHPVIQPQEKRKKKKNTMLENTNIQEVIKRTSKYLKRTALETL
jgi:hypothetical protein